MGMLFTLAWRELRSLFLSPLAWAVLGIMQAVAAYMFLTQTQRYLALQGQYAQLESPPGFTALLVAPYLAGIAALLLIAVPLLTMRCISEERRNKTLVLLQAAPLSNWQLLLGKWLGVYAFLLLLLGLLTLMPLTLSFAGALDFRLLAANVLALALLAALFNSVGLFASCLTRHPMLAALLASCFCLLLWLPDWSGGIVQARNALLQYLSLPDHYRNLQTGLVDSGDVGYFVVSAAVFLVLAHTVLEQQRVRP